METFLLVLLIVFLVIVAIGLLYAFDKAEDIKISDKEKYAKEIKNGDAILIPATLPKYRNYTDVIGFLLVIICFIYLVRKYLQPILDSCYFNESLSLNLLISVNYILVSVVVMYLCQFLVTIFRFRRAKKTGWDGNIKKASYEDRVILKFNKETEKTYKGSIKFDVVLTIIMLATLPNWSIIKQSSSFAEANKLAYEQCISQNNGQ